MWSNVGQYLSTTNVDDASITLNKRQKALLQIDVGHK